MDGIADLAMLSDCRTAALVDRGGTVVWWPSSRFDGPSVFTSLLDPDAGHFTIAPAAPAQTTRSYLDGTLVLRTEHVTGAGTLRVTDALAAAAGARGHELGRQSPGALVRVVEAVGGDVEADVELVPRPEYGLVVPRLERTAGQVVSLGGPERIFLTDGGALDVDQASARGRVRLADGERRAFVLQRAPGLTADAPPPLDGLATLEDTIEAWRSWTAAHEGFRGPYADDVHRAALVIQGLTYQPSGTVVAAATAGLPEVLGGEENWDYRYAWLRDASLVARAMLAATCADEACRYFAWIARAAVSCRDETHVQIVYGVEGERQLDERELDHLDGFAGSRPVRLGNGAWNQRQHDVLGEVLDVALALGDDLDALLDASTCEFLCELADRAARQWDEPDAGMWETRDGDQVHTYSAAMCLVALDRAVQLAPRLGDRADAEGWAQERDRIRAAVLDRAWNPDRQAFCGVLDGDGLDVAVLRLPIVGFVEAGDDRMRATVATIREVLGPDGLVRRLEEREAEGAFLPAVFWLAACHALAGEAGEARAVLDRGLGCANDLGLLPEMSDPRTGAALGNVPQALSHVGLVTAARCLAEVEGTVRA